MRRAVLTAAVVLLWIASPALARASIVDLRYETVDLIFSVEDVAGLVVTETDTDIKIELSGFTFRPDVISIKAATPLTMTAVSDSRIPHDITILTLDGSIVERVDVPPKQTVAFNVVLTTAGRYTFYCSKFLHPCPFGRHGALVVAP